MAAGLLNIGTRNPVKNTPAWVTLEVAHGGFATGAFKAAGLLSDFEKARLRLLGAEDAVSPRLALNLSYMTEQGLAELLQMLDTSCYRVYVPEEAALLVVAYLAATGKESHAHQILAAIEPWMDQLRFYPLPTGNPFKESQTVHLESVGEVSTRLSAIEDRPRILAQNETLNIWNPLHDEFVNLVFRSCSDVDGSGKTPFSKCDATWREQAAVLLARYAELRLVHQRSGKPERRGEVFYELRRLVRKQLEIGDAELPVGDLRRAREVLRRDFAKRGFLDSPARSMLRNRQLIDGKLPTRASAAKVVVARMSSYDHDAGLEKPQDVLSSELNDVEAVCLFGSADWGAEFALPASITTKVARCLQASVSELVQSGVVTSGDVLARLVPQIASRQLATRFNDARVRGLFSQTYRAFRSRRSLLLLHLQKQVQFQELPWVSALLPLASDAAGASLIARQTLVEIAALNLSAFPYAIVPNKLLQEMRSLSAAAQLNLAFLDELAADIFMGEFSRKFGEAVQLAGKQLQGTLYAKYYDFDDDAIARLAKSRGHISSGLGALCASRAGLKGSRWSVANNGCVIEQQQILTTQNVATLFSIPEVADRLQPHLPAMARDSFQWLVGQLSTPQPDWHSRLIAVKNSAYAWRQMVFYLSHLHADDVDTFMSWCDSVLNGLPDDFLVRFRPAMIGLKNAINDRAVESNGGRRLLGWTTKQHWLLKGLG